MLHAVSVGEVNAIRQLVDELAREGGDAVRIVVSTTTDTGTTRAKALFAPRHTVVRYPLDFTAGVRRFLDAVKPDVVGLVELEVWPTFVAECTRRGIAVCVINGRLSERSYGRYRKLRPLVGSAFGSLAKAAVQDEDYAERFAGMGTPAERVQVAGTMKWDTAQIADSVDGADTLAAALGIDRGRPLIVCGSSGPGEEKLFVEALGDLGAQLLIAPRKPERFDEAAAAMNDPVRRSQCPDGSIRRPEPGRNILLDSIGDLRKAYALSDVVVVGRSFCPLYGSDMTEPIALGKPTVIGPNTDDFRDMMAKLLAGDGIVQVPGVAGLRQAVKRLLDPQAGKALAERGRAVIRQQQGATARHTRLILDLLNRHP
jgi:3-deoxy-D-manno-octulosonic-acid transferase